MKCGKYTQSTSTRFTREIVVGEDGLTVATGTKNAFAKSVVPQLTIMRADDLIPNLCELNNVQKYRGVLRRYG